MIAGLEISYATFISEVCRGYDLDAIIHIVVVSYGDRIHAMILTKNRTV